MAYEEAKRTMAWRTRANTQRHLPGVVVLAILGCGKSEFVPADPSDGGSGGISTVGTGQVQAVPAMEMGGNTGVVAVATGGTISLVTQPSHTGGAPDVTSVGEELPCGAVRANAAEFDVELCIQAGQFTMGSSGANLGTGHADHTPPHLVELSTFAIDAFEVTVSRYRACVQQGRCESPSVDTTRGCTYASAKGESDALPVSCVTIAQAEQFCAWDGNRRLPSEAEWERTARGNDERPYPWGNAFSCDRAVGASNGTCANTYKGPKAVGTLPAGDSGYGAHDMAGNVAEWVKDFASSYPSGSVADPVGPATGVTHILRGGSYMSNAPDLQSFSRMTTSGTTQGAFGMRCARSVVQ